MKINLNSRLVKVYTVLKLFTNNVIFRIGNLVFELNYIQKEKVVISNDLA